MATRNNSYLLNEASSGTTPTTCADSSGNCTLTITYNGGSWTSNGAGNGLNLISATGQANGAVAGTNLAASFGTTFTIEGALQCNSSGEGGVNNCGIIGTGGYRLRVFGSFIRIYDNADTFIAAAAHGGLSEAQHVFQSALDFNQLVLLDRVKFWLDGTLLTTINVNIPAQGTTIDFTSATSFRIGTEDATNTAWNVGTYATVLTNTEAANNATALAANNDADPNGGAVAAPAVVAPRPAVAFAANF